MSFCPVHDDKYFQMQKSFLHSSMVEPFYDTVDVGVVQTEMWSQKYLAMREHALSLPKFGTQTANSEVRGNPQWIVVLMFALLMVWQ